MNASDRASLIGGPFAQPPSLVRDPLIWVLVVLSVAVHLLVVRGVLNVTDPSSPPPWAPALDEAAQPLAPKVRAGIESSEHSTLTWLGFTEPEEHQARLDTIDQAAMSPEPIAAPPKPKSVPVQGSPAEQSPPVERMPEPDPTPPTEPVTPTAVAAIERSLSDGMTRAMELAKSLREQAMLAVALSDRAQTQQPSAEPSKPVEPSKPTPPTKAGVATDADGRDHEPEGGAEATPQQATESEKESPATSTIKPVRVRPGKPAAAQGLDITTVRPKWTFVTRLSALPKDPVLWVKFDRTGKVTHVGFVEGKSTGDDRVDGPLIDALYLWTAKGKALEKLAEGETLTMTFAIDLGAR